MPAFSYERMKGTGLISPTAAHTRPCHPSVMQPIGLPTLCVSSYPAPGEEWCAQGGPFFCAPTVAIFYQAVYSKPPNYQVIVLVNCTLILVFLLNVCTVFELIVEENPSDKTLHPLPLIARKCRIKSCKLPSTIRYSPKWANFQEPKWVWHKV